MYMYMAYVHVYLHICNFLSSYSKGLAPFANLLAKPSFFILSAFVTLSLLTLARDEQELEQLHFECTILIICQSNHCVGVPMLFEDREWRPSHNR